MTPEYIRVVTTQSSYHAGLFSASFFNSVIDPPSLFEVLFLWHVPLVSDSHVLVKMRAEGDSEHGLWATLAVRGIFHGVQGMAGCTACTKTSLLVLVPLFRVISLLVLKNLQKFFWL